MIQNGLYLLLSFFFLWALIFLLLPHDFILASSNFFCCCLLMLFISLKLLLVFRFIFVLIFSSVIWFKRCLIVWASEIYLINASSGGLFAQKFKPLLKPMSSFQLSFIFMILLCQFFTESGCFT